MKITEAIPCPEGISYRDFQSEGIRFAIRNMSCLIADDMGVGKTVQALGLLNHMGVEAPRAVVVCPSRLRRNWVVEAQKWLAHKREVVAPDKADERLPIVNCLIVVNVEKLVMGRAGGMLDALMKYPIDLLIVDEAHRYSNAKKSFFKAVYSERKTKNLGLATVSKRILLLTGTPMPNRPSDMASWMSYLWPEIFESEFKFKQRYCDGKRVPIQVKGAKWGTTKKVWDFSGSSNLEELNRKMQAFTIRRTKKEVLDELPEKQRQLIEVDLEAPLLKWDNDKIDGNFAQFRNKLDQAPPALLLNASAGLTKELQAAGLEKVNAIKEIAEDALLDPDRRLIIFTWHRRVTDALVKAISEPAVVLDGRSSAAQAKEAFEAFQNGEARLFIGSLRAAGVGLTLTAGSHVIMAQPSWVPSDMLQAEDRAYRMGQMLNVLIQYVVASGTVEADVVKSALKKLSDSENAIDGNTQALGFTTDQRTLAAEFCKIILGDDVITHGMDPQFDSREKMYLSSFSQRSILTQKQCAVVARFCDKNRDRLPEIAVRLLAAPLRPTR